MASPVESPFGSSITTEDIVDTLGFFDGWEERYKYIIDLGKQLPVMDDSSALNLAEAANSNQWIKSQAENLNFGFSDSAYWVTSTIQNTSPDLLWYLHIRYPLFDEIDVYLCPENTKPTTQNCQHTKMGDHLAFSERDIAHPEFTLIAV